MRTNYREAFQRALEVERKIALARGGDTDLPTQPPMKTARQADSLPQLGGADWITVLDRIERERSTRRTESLALAKLNKAIFRLHGELEDVSEYVHCEEASGSDSRASGIWMVLVVESCDDVPVRAALNSTGTAGCIVEFEDGRHMSFKEYEKWLIGYAARGAHQAELLEKAKGFAPVGRRTYDEGFAFGETYARSLTVRRLLQFRDWLDTVSSGLDGCALWMALHGETGSADGNWKEIHAFWNVDPEPSGRISRIAALYLKGFADGAGGVASRVSDSLPS